MNSSLRFSASLEVFSGSGDAARRALRRRARGIILLIGTFVALGMVGIFTSMVWRERGDALNRALQQAGDLALIAQRDISRNLELYSLSLQAIADGSQKPAAMALPMDLRREYLFDRSMRARNIISAAILDEHGHLVLNMRGRAPLGLDWSSHGYFRSHLVRPDASVHISEPFPSTVDSNTRVVALSRRITRADGTFGGVAVVYINVNYFRNLLEGLDIGPHGRTTVYGPNARVIVSSPYDAWLEGADRHTSPIYQAISAADHGHFIADSAVDGAQRAFVFRAMPGFDMRMLVALALTDIYAPWRWRALLIIGSAVAFAALLVLVSDRLGHELAARLRAEDSLQHLANTDMLTGLANRRAIERILHREGSRARRPTAGLGVLFVDVDYFKRYNDTEGHPQGDKVLQAVGKALGSAMQRPGDRAGRYGGEEFLAVLSQTDAAGAHAVGERVRAAVEALAIPHRGSPLGVVTVSIGVAAMSQEPFGDLQALVNSADKAMYAAKENGRNQVRLHRAGVAAAARYAPAPAIS